MARTKFLFKLHSDSNAIPYIQVKELVMDCESPILQDTANKLADIHEEFEAQAEVRAKLKPEEAKKEKDWKWTGSRFVQSPTVEPWVNLICDVAKIGKI